MTMGDISRSYANEDILVEYLEEHRYRNRKNYMTHSHSKLLQETQSQEYDEEGLPVDIEEKNDEEELDDWSG